MSAIKIDLESPFAGFQLVAAMHWPSDPLARDDYLVTVAAQLQPTIEHAVPRAVERKLLDTAALVAEMIGSSVEDVLARMDVAKARQQASAVVAHLSAEIDTQLFRPSGGFGRVAAAGGTEAIHKDAAVRGRKFGAACGEILTYIVMMETHHPGSRPSINRATHIMDKCAKKEGRTIPGERDRKVMWTLWGPVAPLWAAAALCESSAKARGLLDLSFHDSGLRRDVVAASLWLADFAVTFVPTGAKAPLLSENKVVRLSCDLQAAKPEIPSLTAEMLAWANAYKAPIPPP